MTTPPEIFNRKLYGRRRARAAAGFAAHDFLHRRVLDDIVDRLETVNRRFEMAVFDGAGDFRSALTPRCGVDCAIAMDMLSATPIYWELIQTILCF